MSGWRVGGKGVGARLEGGVPVRACMRACVRACVRVCVCDCEGERVGVCLKLPAWELQSDNRIIQYHTYKDNNNKNEIKQ